MPVCGSCHKEISVCTICEGLLCSSGCEHRVEDGCACEEEDLVEDEPEAEKDEDEE